MGIKRVYSEDNHCEMYQADYRVKLSTGRLKRIRKLYFTKDAAIKAIRRDKVAAENGDYNSPSKITLRDLKERVTKYVKLHRKGTTVASYENILTLFNRVIGEGRKLESVDRSDLRRFVEYLRNDKKSDSTVKTYLSKIIAALNLAPQLFEELSSWQAPKYRFEGYVRPRERVLEPDEILAILEHVKPDVRDIVLCALNTGGRLREVLSLRWDCIFWSAPGYTHGALKLRVTKVRGIKETFRLVPATKEVREILERRRASANGSPLVFPSPWNKRKPRTDLRYALMVACEKAKIIYGRDTRGGFVFHDLRRTAVTYLRRAGVEIEDVCAITGHSPTIMLQVYSKSSVERQQAAVDALAKSLPFGQLKESGKTEVLENPPANDSQA